VNTHEVQAEKAMTALGTNGAFLATTKFLPSSLPRVLPRATCLVGDRTTAVPKFGCLEFLWC